MRKESNMSLKVILRHGIAAPVSVDLAPAEVTHIARLSMEEGIEFLLGKTSLPAGSIAAFRETLRDPHCIIELRQGDLVKVFTRRQAIGTEIAPLNKPGPDWGLAPQPTIEIGLAKAQQGGSQHQLQAFGWLPLFR
jgi:hypothetical protein